MTRLTVLGAFLGAVIGVVVSFFGQMIVWLGEIRDDNIFVFLPFLPIVGVVVIWLYQRYLSQSKQGLILMFDIANEKTQLPISYLLVIMIGSYLTHLFGGSAGRTGAAIQIGASLAYLFYPYICYHYKTSQMFIFTGMAAGFASLFQLPLAAVCFALEILPWKKLTIQIVFVAFIASLTAGVVSFWSGLIPFRHELTIFYDLNLRQFGQLILLGILFGLVGNTFAFLMTHFKRLIPRYLPNVYWRIFLLSLILVVSLYQFEGRYSGLGSGLISFGNQDNVLHYDWFLKMLLTVMTVSIGFQGGEVTPLFAIGSSFGGVLSTWTDLPSELVIALGYLSVFASATNTFLTPLLLSVGIFGGQHVIPFLVTLSVAYLLRQDYSIYPNERRFLVGEKAHKLIKKQLNL